MLFIFLPCMGMQRKGKMIDWSRAHIIREYSSTLYLGLGCAVPPTNTNFWLTFLLTRLQEALYEDLDV